MRNIRAISLDTPVRINSQRHEKEADLRYSSYITSSMYRTGYLTKKPGIKIQWNSDKGLPGFDDAAKVLDYAMSWSKGSANHATHHIQKLVNDFYNKKCSLHVKQNMPQAVIIKDLSDEMLTVELSKRGYMVKKNQEEIVVTIHGPIKSGKTMLTDVIMKAIYSIPKESINYKILQDKIIRLEEGTTANNVMSVHRIYVK